MGPDVPSRTIARYFPCTYNKEYSYFSYNANEALHLSEQERKVVIECMNNVAEELRHPIDKHSRSLIIDTMKLLLDRCIRFYNRQFITRENANNDLLARFELLLNNYYHSALPTSKGIPTVQYCADQLCLSTNYFSDLVKKETGMSAIKHIQQKIMDIAKERIMNTQKVSVKSQMKWVSNTRNISHVGSRRWKVAHRTNIAMKL